MKRKFSRVHWKLELLIASIGLHHYMWLTVDLPGKPESFLKLQLLDVCHDQIRSILIKRQTRTRDDNGA